MTSQELIFSTRETSGSEGRQIFTAQYRVEEGAFMPDRPVRWKGGIALGTSFDVHPDGERLLVKSMADVKDTDPTFDHVVLFENFFEHVRKQLSTSEN